MVFDEVYIENSTWLSISTCSAFRNRLDKLIEIISEHYLNPASIGKQIRLIGGNQWKIRLNSDLRLPYEIRKENQKLLLIIGRVLTHDEGSQLHQEEYIFPDMEEMINIFNSEQFAENVEENSYFKGGQMPLYREWNLFHHQRLLENDNSDLPWVLHDEQKKYCQLPGPILLKGNAGSGKTTIAMYRLISSINEVIEYNRLYLTYTKQLSNHAKFLYEQVGLYIDSNRPQFSTVDELCLQILEASNKSHIYFDINDKVSFEVFCLIPSFRHFKKSQMYVLWEQIRGVIKGHESINVLKTNCLSFQEYLNISNTQILLSDSERQCFYKAFQKYQEYTNDNKLWDELDLAQEAYKITIENQYITRYDEIIVDEVQDLTSFHIRLILQLSSNYEGLFLAGDVHQAIHPSRFDWKRVKAIMFEHLRNLSESRQYYGRLSQQLHELNINFRSPKPIIDFANHIIEWRNSHFIDDSSSKLKATQDGENIYLINDLTNIDKYNIQLSHEVMVIVWDDKAKSEVASYFNKGAIFTIHESKGLERNHVILWKFFSASKKYWEDLCSYNCSNNELNIYKYKYIINLLNVAITRPRKILLLIDDYIPDSWQPIKSIELISGKLASDKFNEIISIKSSAQDYIDLAWELEQSEIYEQAAENYLLADNLQNANRCRGHLAKKSRDFLLAADFYDKSNLPSLIVDVFECYGHHALTNGNYSEAYSYYKMANISSRKVIIKCNEFSDYRNAFLFLLQSPDLIRENSIFDLNYYLSDDKRLSKLSNLYFEIFNNLKNETNKAVTIDFFIEYSKLRVEHLKDKHLQLVKMANQILSEWNTFLPVLLFLQENITLLSNEPENNKNRELKFIMKFINEIKNSINSIAIISKKMSDISNTTKTFFDIYTKIVNITSPQELLKSEFFLETIEKISFLDEKLDLILEQSMLDLRKYRGIRSSLFFDHILNFTILVLIIISNKKKISSILQENKSFKNVDKHFSDFNKTLTSFKLNIKKLVSSNIFKDIYSDSNDNKIYKFMIFLDRIEKNNLIEKYGLPIEYNEFRKELNLFYLGNNKLEENDKKIKKDLFENLSKLFIQWNYLKATKIQLISRDISEITRKSKEFGFIHSSKDRIYIIKKSVNEIIYVGRFIKNKDIVELQSHSNNFSNMLYVIDELVSFLKNCENR